MSNYKHGNWYCKPANESEAREIVERAVASGARLYETLGNWDWNDYGAWGVCFGRTHTQKADFYIEIDAIEYTITQVRQKFPLPGEQTTEWDGEGFPSDGDECEAYIYADTIGQGKIKAKWVDGHAGCKAIAGNGGYGCIFIQKNGAIHFIESTTHFRPIRTERERRADDAGSNPASAY